MRAADGRRAEAFDRRRQLRASLGVETRPPSADCPAATANRPSLPFSARLGPAAKLPDVEQGSKAVRAIRHVTGKILSAFGRALAALVEARKGTEMADYHHPYHRGAG